MSETVAPVELPAKAIPGWLRFFAPAPPLSIVTTDPVAIQTLSRKWQFRILLWSTVGYATFYLVRKNLPIAMPVSIRRMNSLGMKLRTGDPG